MAEIPSSPVRLPSSLLSLSVFLLTIPLFLVLPIPNDLGRAALSILIAWGVLLLAAFLLPAPWVERFVSKSGLLVNASISVLFGLVSSIFLPMSIVPWLVSWLVLCFLWLLLPGEDFHDRLEERFDRLLS
jgi:hypothetical protein